MLINVNVVSNEVLDYLKKFEKENLDIKINELLEIGVSIIDRVSLSRDMSFVKKETEKMLTSFNANLSQLFSACEKRTIDFVDTNFDAGDEGSYVYKFVDYMRNGLKEFKTETIATTKLMLENVKEVSTDKIVEVKTALEITKESIVKFQQALNDQTDFKRMDSFPAKLLKETEKYFGKESPIVNVVHNIVSDFSGGITEELIKLREEISRKSGEAGMLEKTAIKGFAFEEEAFKSLSEYAKQYGDVVEETGKTTKGGASKKGDFVYTFSEGQSIVIECKDETVGLKPMLEYLKEAIVNRECSLGILVTKRVEQLPNQVGEFNLYEGNKLFVSFDMLHFALRWVRLYLQKIAAKQNESNSVNVSLIETKLEVIKNQMKNFAVIKTKLTKMLGNVDSSVVEIRTSLDNLKDAIENEFNSIEEVIR